MSLLLLLQKYKQEEVLKLFQLLSFLPIVALSHFPSFQLSPNTFSIIPSHYHPSLPTLHSPLSLLITIPLYRVYPPYILHYPFSLPSLSTHPTFSIIPSHYHPSLPTLHSPLSLLKSCYPSLSIIPSLHNPSNLCSLSIITIPPNVLSIILSLLISPTLSLKLSHFPLSISIVYYSSTFKLLPFLTDTCTCILFLCSHFVTHILTRLKVISLVSCSGYKQNSSGLIIPIRSHTVFVISATVALSST